MFIQTEETADPAELKFLPGTEVLPGATASFASADEAGPSPLAARLFEIEAVERVSLGADHIVLTKSDEADWQTLKPAVLGAIMDHFVAGRPVMAEGAEGATAPAAGGGQDDISAQIQELVETRIRPAAADQGGDVIFHEFKEGAAIIEFIGAAHMLRGGVQTMLRHYLPQVERVVDYQDTIPKPGLDTIEGQTIQKLLDEQVNPQVAMHGGHIALVDVQDTKVYIRLEGGCQGCGMASMTLKHGVEVAIKEAVPSIEQVLDTTDHAGGDNPYFQPGKEGMSAY